MYYLMVKTIEDHNYLVSIEVTGGAVLLRSSQVPLYGHRADTRGLFRTYI